MSIQEQFGRVVPGGGKQPPTAANRMKQIEAELGKASINGTLSQSELDRYFDEYHKLETKTKALKYASNADSAEFNQLNGGLDRRSDPFNPSPQNNPKVAVKKWRSPTAKDLSGVQIKSL
jgi:hypothetical protein